MKADKFEVTVVVKMRKPRNPTVPAMRNKKAGKHFRSERKHIRDLKRGLFD